MTLSFYLFAQISLLCLSPVHSLSFSRYFPLVPFLSLFPHLSLSLSLITSLSVFVQVALSIAFFLSLGLSFSLKFFSICPNLSLLKQNFFNCAFGVREVRPNNFRPIF